jgi:RNA polymerase sigma-70 factor (ECF subfamily)
MQPFPGRRRRIRTAPRPASRLDYATLGDAVLVRRAKDGDDNALAALCARHRPRVERTALRLLRDPDDAQDATQETLARVCTKLEGFRGDASFTTWLHRLTLNACYDAATLRARTPAAALAVEDVVGDDETPVRAAERGELRAALTDGLATLPADQARVVVLKDAVGLTFEEIADRTGMPVGTAKCYAHRGRASLRMLLEDAPT